MHFYTIEKRSNFLRTPGITTYHSYLFHGGSEREGRWFPNEPEVDVLTPSPSDLHVVLYRHRLSEFLWPSLNPLVSETVKELLGVLPFIRYQQVIIDKVIEFEWSIGRSISVSPGDLSRQKFFQRFPSEPTEAISALFELQGLHMVSFPTRQKSLANSDIEIECGTEPFVHRNKISVSTALFAEAPVFSKVCRWSVLTAFLPG